MDPDNLGVFHAGPIDTSLAPAAIIEPAVLVLTNSGAENPAAVKYIENWLGSGMETWGRGSGWWPGALDLMLPNQHYVDSYAVKAEIPELQSILRWWEASATELQFDITSELIGFMLNPTMEQAESAMANMQAINSAYWADQ